MSTPAKDISDPATTTGSPVVETIPTDPEEIKMLLRKQVEYYFSKENLTHDAFLTSQMDAQMSAPIAVIMKVEFCYYLLPLSIAVLILIWCASVVWKNKKFNTG